MHIERFLHVSTRPDMATRDAVVWSGATCTYGKLAEEVSRWDGYLAERSIGAGRVIALRGDFSPTAIALLLALIERRVIVAPLTVDEGAEDATKFEIGQMEGVLDVDCDTGAVGYRDLPGHPHHALYQVLRERGSPGLLLFTSGTSGRPKGAVHDFSKLLAKFDAKRTSMRTLNFLLFDHWGGLNTMFHALSSGGTVLGLRHRSPELVCALIETLHVELLPCSPTFLNLLLLSGAHRSHDLSSLRLITYGTEPMPETTLHRIRAELPWVRLQQTYGLVELGVLRSRSRDDDSLWVKVGGEGFETRVVDGILQIRAASAMLGYLNASSPFTEDGFFVTGDRVEVDGEYIRILGRDSEIINVGGKKVFPQEIENAILGFENVADAVVYGEPSAITGWVVCAEVALREGCTDPAVFARRLKAYLRGQLAPFKVPVKIFVRDRMQMTARFKKARVAEGAGSR